jgi:subtilisin family serine protease
MKAKVIARINKRLFPSTQNIPLPDPLRPNDIIEVVEKVTGEALTAANNIWYKTDAGFFVWSGGVSEELVQEILPAGAKVEVPALIEKIDLRKLIVLNTPINFGGQGTCIGLLDTGVSDHPAIGKSIDSARSKTFIEGETSAIDDVGHGTGLAGIISGEDERVAGLSTLCKVINYRIASNGFVDSNAIFFGLKNLIENEIGDLDIINLSLDIRPSLVGPIQELLDKAAQRGVIAVVAAGENMTNNNIASLKNVVQVSVCDADFFAKFQLGLVRRASYIFINKGVFSPALKKGYQEIKNDSAYTAVMTGIISSIISSHNLPRNSSRFSMLNNLLRAVSFPIKNEQTPISFKSYFV